MPARRCQLFLLAAINGTADHRVCSPGPVAGRRRPFSASTLWRRVRDHSFPAPMKLSAGVTAWRVEDLRAWMENQPAQPRITRSTSGGGGSVIDHALIEKLAVVLAAQPPIPIEIDLWDVATIARLLKRNESQVRNRIICLPDFPKAIRLPVAGGPRLYRAAEVLAWVSSIRTRISRRRLLH